MAVALLAEGVDRNYGSTQEKALRKASPSSRRAWIEIMTDDAKIRVESVALLAEGVDRNYCVVNLV